MLDVVEDDEVRLALVVGFENCRGFDALDAVFREVRCHLVNNQRVNSPILIVWTYGNEEQIEIGHLLRLQCLEQVVPTEREESTSALTQSLRE